MPETGFVRPTLAAIRSRLAGATTALRRNDRTVEATAIAGAAHQLHGHLDAVARQVLPDTADAEHLDRHAAVWGKTRKPAATAAGTVTVTGTGVLPEGTLLQRGDGALYRVTAEVAVSGSAVAAVAAVDAGLAGDAEAGTGLGLISPVAGLSSSATVDTIAGGADAESDADLLARLLARIQDPPHGGAQNDYVAWALEVEGVTRAWCLPRHLGAGTVGVPILCDGQADSIFPTPEKIAEVQAYLDLRRPVTAEVVVFAPAAVAMDVRVSLTPSTTAVRQAVQDALADLIDREAAPGATILLSHIREAISLAAGESDHVLIAPAANVAIPAGSIAVLGTVTWG